MVIREALPFAARASAAVCGPQIPFPVDKIPPKGSQIGGQGSQITQQLSRSPGGRGSRASGEFVVLYSSAEAERGSSAIRPAPGYNHVTPPSSASPSSLVMGVGESWRRKHLLSRVRGTAAAGHFKRPAGRGEAACLRGSKTGRWWGQKGVGRGILVVSPGREASNKRAPGRERPPARSPGEGREHGGFPNASGR